MLDLILKSFDRKEQDIRTYSPLTLAYLGDSVYELVIRTLVVEEANRAVRELNKRTVRYVNAASQARMAAALKGMFTEEEADVYKRGRNAKPATTAKNATLSDYHKATGFEALIGYLYLTGRQERMMELIRQGMISLKDGEKNEGQTDGR